MVDRVSVWILGDQLMRDHPALRTAVEQGGQDRVRVVLVESQAWERRLPFHRKRQVLHRSAGRHFAEKLTEQGFEVDRIEAKTTREGLARHLKQHRSHRLLTMAAADHVPRVWQLGTMARDLGVEAEVLPNAMFLVGRYNPIPDPEPGRRYVMETFYRAMRKHFGLLIEGDGKPTSGRWNLDAENRRRLPKTITIPPVPRFEPDAITRKVMTEVEDAGFGVGSVEGFALPVTHDEAEASFDDFLQHRLESFGPFEDAMSRSEGVLFHSVLSPQMNLGLLDPLEMAQAVEAEYRGGRVPLNSAEGFIRQVIGWREFMFWQYHRQMPGLRSANSWNAPRPLPRFFWDGQTEMACLRSVIGRLIDSGYTHHIERLMILCNFATLAGINPQAVADWFLAFYVDSHDWVVLPNVIGMGLNADDGLTATKPYIASASYIKRMSDFCGDCSYRPDRRVGPDACPFNALYWNFLIEHEDTLRANPRLGPAVLGLKRVDDAERTRIQAQASAFLRSLEPYESDRRESPR
ncbi:cryptochrome/photolyase family protein [Tautonia rosea]|uniref:cryptochrome/photolyase family protein n=1 Tax=Tautonia rosea TaxID=2728037 RepID=UPI0014767FC8|nr:cryptochrome/photolyase family protein [Tautonia rosea]